MADQNAGANQSGSNNDAGDAANSGAEGNKPEGQQANDNSSNAGSNTQNKDQKPTEEKSFSQTDLNNFLAKEKRKWETNAKLTPEQLLQKELDELKAEKAEAGFADQFKSQAGTKSGAWDLDVVFTVMRKHMDFDEKGKITNFDTVMKLARAKHPSLFKQAAGSQDAGAGGDKTSGFSMNNWLRGKN